MIKITDKYSQLQLVTVGNTGSLTGLVLDKSILSRKLGKSANVHGNFGKFVWFLKKLDEEVVEKIGIPSLSIGPSFSCIDPIQSNSMISMHATVEELHSMIGMKVGKVSGKPFKSTFKINTVKEICDHPILHIPSFLFIEDDSYVACRQCYTKHE